MVAVHTETSDEADDLAIIENSWQDPQRFAEIFDRYFAEIRGYVARRLGPDIADDVAAETFATAFRKRASFRSGLGTVRSWLYGIASNQMGLHRRSEVRRYAAVSRLGVERDPDGHENRVTSRVTAAGSGAALAAVLARMPAKDREVLLLVALADLTYEEVSQALGIPYGTVCSRLNRARRKARAALGAEPNVALDSIAPEEKSTQHG